MEKLIDCEGTEVFLGDKVRGEGFLSCQDGFKIDRTPTVTVRENNGVIYFGSLSKSSFNKFWKVAELKKNLINKDL